MTIHISFHGHLFHEPGICFFSQPRLERLAAPKSTVSLDGWKSSRSLFNQSSYHRVFFYEGSHHGVLLVLNVSQSGCKQKPRVSHLSYCDIDTSRRGIPGGKVSTRFLDARQHWIRLSSATEHIIHGSFLFQLKSETRLVWPPCMNSLLSCQC